jgi:hypothetical protein
MRKPIKPVAMSLDDFAKDLIQAAKDFTEEQQMKDPQFRALVEKDGKAKAIGMLLSGMHNFNERPRS